MTHVRVLHMSPLRTSNSPEIGGLCGPQGLADSAKELSCVSHQELLGGLASGQGGLYTGVSGRKAATVTPVREASQILRCQKVHCVGLCGD